jgi:hypothetical protein
MKKFSKLNESLNKEILGWSPNDILEYLEKIPNCRPNYRYTHFIFRDDGHEICSLEDIKDGVIKSTYADDFTLDPEQEYYLNYSFRLEFGNLTRTENYLLFDKGEEKETQESIPLSKITKIFTDIENSITSLRSDFFIHLYYEKPLELHNLFIDLEFTSKDMAEKEYLLR